jgi:hypothetical protein
MTGRCVRRRRSVRTAAATMVVAITGVLTGGAPAGATTAWTTYHADLSRTPTAASHL